MGLVIVLPIAGNRGLGVGKRSVEPEPIISAKGFRACMPAHNSCLWLLEPNWDPFWDNSTSSGRREAESGCCRDTWRLTVANNALGTTRSLDWSHSILEVVGSGVAGLSGEGVDARRVDWGAVGEVPGVGTRGTRIASWDLGLGHDCLRLEDVTGGWEGWVELGWRGRGLGPLTAGLAGAAAGRLARRPWFIQGWRWGKVGL